MNSVQAHCGTVSEGTPRPHRELLVGRGAAGGRSARGSPRGASPLAPALRRAGEASEFAAAEEAGEASEAAAADVK